MSTFDAQEHPRKGAGANPGEFAAKARAGASGALREPPASLARAAADAITQGIAREPKPQPVHVYDMLREDAAAFSVWPDESRVALDYLVRIPKPDFERMQAIARSDLTSSSRVMTLDVVMQDVRALPTARDIGGYEPTLTVRDGVWSIQSGLVSIDGEADLPDMDRAPYAAAPTQVQLATARIVWAGIAARSSARERGDSSLCLRQRHMDCVMCSCECHGGDL